MKKKLEFVSGLILSTIILGATATYVPPVWAMCRCVYNEMKSSLVFPGSLIGALIVMFFTLKRAQGGGKYWKFYTFYLFCAILVFSIIGFLLFSISDFIEYNDIPLFQPEPMFIDTSPVFKY